MAENLGAALRLLRTQAGFTQRQLAEAVGVARTSIVNFEQGGTSPSFDTICRVLEALGGNLVDLHEAMVAVGGGPGAPGEESPDAGLRLEGRWLSPEEVERRIDAAFDRLVERTVVAAEVVPRGPRRRKEEQGE